MVRAIAYGGGNLPVNVKQECRAEFTADGEYQSPSAA